MNYGAVKGVCVEFNVLRTFKKPLGSGLSAVRDKAKMVSDGHLLVEFGENACRHAGFLSNSRANK